MEGFVSLVPFVRLLEVCYWSIFFVWRALRLGSFGEQIMAGIHRKSLQPKTKRELEERGSNCVLDEIRRIEEF